MGNRKPKPHGKGNWVYCDVCKGMGGKLHPKKYTGKRIWAPNRTINLALPCKNCNGTGWTMR